ncbi:MAG: hypothetical protein LKG62_00535 [Solobacterium sp.]|jgi:hypothetical protein|nr:hypothetical protein [Solobacterium sp.]MCI1462288.1 hypothetical protein [Solobacterium sp.]MEE1334185.1 hypothetical protein [Erysipelotrichaceae bacterium]
MRESRLYEAAADIVLTRYTGYLPRTERKKLIEAIKVWDEEPCHHYSTTPLQISNDFLHDIWVVYKDGKTEFRKKEDRK